MWDLAQQGLRMAIRRIKIAPAPTAGNAILETSSGARKPGSSWLSEDIEAEASTVSRRMRFPPAKLSTNCASERTAEKAAGKYS
jgi:hypothetical protein